jgi:hypothetical protein
MQGNEAKSSFIMEQLLGTLGSVLIAPRFWISTQVVVQNPSLSGNPPPVPPATKLLQQALVAEHGGNAGRRVYGMEGKAISRTPCLAFPPCS